MGLSLEDFEPGHQLGHFSRYTDTYAYMRPGNCCTNGVLVDANAKLVAIFGLQFLEAAVRCTLNDFELCR